MELLYRIASAHREAELTSATGLIDAGAQLGSVIIAVTILTLMTALVVFAFSGRSWWRLAHSLRAFPAAVSAEVHPALVI